MCKRIVTAYDGDLSVTSELGKGSKFSFQFKVKDFSYQEIPSETENTPCQEKEPEHPKG